MIHHPQSYRADSLLSPFASCSTCASPLVLAKKTVVRPGSLPSPALPHLQLALDLYLQLTPPTYPSPVKTDVTPPLPQIHKPPHLFSINLKHSLQNNNNNNNNKRPSSQKYRLLLGELVPETVVVTEQEALSLALVVQLITIHYSHVSISI